ncbi:MAG: potassium-transporting ATPase subunit KdpC [Alphaproteobacteria bacterium]
MNAIFAVLRSSLMLLVCITLITGIVYPVVVTALSQLVFYHKATGSLIERDGKVIGSELLGQYFTKPQYFWGRPSATTPPYNAAASGASNLSPANTKLRAAINERIMYLKKSNPDNDQPVPVDLVTSSASGLDPHISIAAAQWQAMRVAKHRKMKTEDVLMLIYKHSEDSLFGVVGQPRVNVLHLNLRLDELSQAANTK